MPTAMPPPVTPPAGPRIAETREGRLSVLRLAIPGEGEVTAGVLLQDPAADRLYVRLRRDWERVAPDEADVLEELAADLTNKAGEMGAGGLLAHLERELSNAILLSDQESVLVEDFPRALERLYRKHVQPNVIPFATHVPRYSDLELAAGPFRENRDQVEQEIDWEELPEGVRANEDLFAGQIFGRSMEPDIPDGAVCLFRRGVSGSRQGRLVLVQELGRGGSQAFTVKRYWSEKRASRTEEESSWSHERIRLEALNPEFGEIELTPDEQRYAVIAEFVRVLY